MLLPPSRGRLPRNSPPPGWRQSLCPSFAAGLSALDLIGLLVAGLFVLAGRDPGNRDRASYNVSRPSFPVRSSRHGMIPSQVCWANKSLELPVEIVQPLVNVIEALTVKAGNLNEEGMVVD